jgi:hypothetical protein
VSDLLEKPLESAHHILKLLVLRKEDVDTSIGDACWRVVDLTLQLYPCVTKSVVGLLEVSNMVERASVLATPDDFARSFTAGRIVVVVVGISVHLSDWVTFDVFERLQGFDRFGS